jgi:hypothetical protein
VWLGVYLFRAVIMKTVTRYRSFALLVLLFSGTPLAFGWQVDVPPERAALSGAWTVNKDLSDKLQMPGAAEREDREGQPPPGRGGGMGGFGGGRGRGDAPGGGGDRPNLEEMRKLQAQTRAVLEVPERLMITVEAEAVILTYGDGRTQRMLTNGKKEKLKIDDTAVETQVKWDKARLVKISSLDGGTKVTETYAVDKDPRRLQVTVKIENWRMPQPQTVHRVYDDATAR